MSQSRDNIKDFSTDSEEDETSETSSSSVISDSRTAFPAVDLLSSESNTVSQVAADEDSSASKSAIEEAAVTSHEDNRTSDFIYRDDGSSKQSSSSEISQNLPKPIKTSKSVEVIKSESVQREPETASNLTRQSSGTSIDLTQKAQKCTESADIDLKLPFLSDIFNKAKFEKEFASPAKEYKKIPQPALQESEFSQNSPSKELKDPTISVDELKSKSVHQDTKILGPPKKRPYPSLDEDLNYQPDLKKRISSDKLHKNPEDYTELKLPTASDIFNQGKFEKELTRTAREEHEENLRVERRREPETSSLTSKSSSKQTGSSSRTLDAAKQPDEYRKGNTQGSSTKRRLISSDDDSEFQPDPKKHITSVEQPKNEQCEEITSTEPKIPIKDVSDFINKGKFEIEFDKMVEEDQKENPQLQAQSDPQKCSLKILSKHENSSTSSNDAVKQPDVPPKSTTPTTPIKKRYRSFDENSESQLDSSKQTSSKTSNEKTEVSKDWTYLDLKLPVMSDIFSEKKFEKELTRFETSSDQNVSQPQEVSPEILSSTLSDFFKKRKSSLLRSILNSPNSMSSGSKLLSNIYGKSNFEAFLPTESQIAPEELPSGSLVASDEIPSGSRIIPEEIPSSSWIIPEEIPRGSRIAPEEMPSGSRIAPEEMPSGSRIAPEAMPSGSRIAPEETFRSWITPEEIFGSWIAPGRISFGSQIYPKEISSGARMVREEILSGSQSETDERSSGSRNDTDEGSSGSRTDTEEIPFSQIPRYMDQQDLTNLYIRDIFICLRLSELEHDISEYNRDLNAVTLEDTVKLGIVKPSTSSDNSASSSNIESDSNIPSTSRTIFTDSANFDVSTLNYNSRRHFSNWLEQLTEILRELGHGMNEIVNDIQRELSIDNFNIVISNLKNLYERIRKAYKKLCKDFFPNCHHRIYRQLSKGMERLYYDFVVIFKNFEDKVESFLNLLRKCYTGQKLPDEFYQ